MSCASEEVARLADLWGGLLEEYLAEGVPLDVAAEATYMEALEKFRPEGGLSGFTFLNTVTTLSNVLVGGQLLRKWYRTKGLGV